MSLWCHSSDRVCCFTLRDPQEVSFLCLGSWVGEVLINELSWGSCSRNSCSARKQNPWSPENNNISSIGSEGFRSPRLWRWRNLLVLQRFLRPKVSSSLCSKWVICYPSVEQKVCLGFGWMYRRPMQLPHDKRTLQQSRNSHRKWHDVCSHLRLKANTLLTIVLMARPSDLTPKGLYFDRENCTASLVRFTIIS